MKALTYIGRGRFEHRRDNVVKVAITAAFS